MKPRCSLRDGELFAEFSVPREGLRFLPSTTLGGGEESWRVEVSDPDAAFALISFLWDAARKLEDGVPSAFWGSSR